MRSNITVINNQVHACTACRLVSTSRQVCVGGTEALDILFVLENDYDGHMLSASSMDLFERMIHGMGLRDGQWAVTKLVKCNTRRELLLEEVVPCSPFLELEVEALTPRVIVAMGRLVAESLGVYSGPAWRGRWGWSLGTAVMTTYHPSFLVRHPITKYQKLVSRDMLSVLRHLKEN